MNIFGTRQDITTDPRFGFMVGRLAGAAEMAAICMMDASQNDKVDLVQLGGRLDTIARWFIDPDKKDDMPQIQPPRYPEYENVPDA